LIYCSDQEIVREEIERNFPEDRLIAWSDKEGADFTRIIKKEATETRLISSKKICPRILFGHSFVTQLLWKISPIASLQSLDFGSASSKNSRRSKSSQTG